MYLSHESPAPLLQAWFFINFLSMDTPLADEAPIQQ